MPPLSIAEAELWPLAGGGFASVLESGGMATALQTAMQWETLSDEDLLDVRLRDLKLRIEGTWLEECLNALHEELAKRELPLRPHAWLSTEWFVPRGILGIAIPFYLAHPPHSWRVCLRKGDRRHRRVREEESGRAEVPRRDHQDRRGEERGGWNRVSR